jgi:deoxycytidylate deaminase
VKANRTETSEGPEIIIGLVGALGSNLDLLTVNLESVLADVNYHSQRVRLSSLLTEISGWEKAASGYLDKYISNLQKKGNELRQKTKSGDALAILAGGRIQRIRKQISGNAETPAERVAYILRSLKHPAEVKRLRSVYGPYFYLIAAYAPFQSRLQALAEDIASSHQSTKADDYFAKAQDLIHTDEAETDSEYGQRVRDTFPLADAFFNVDKPEELSAQIERFIEILFGHPFQTPTRDEFGMFHARASALRSADLSLQVGAVISTVDGDLVSVGTNEVPRADGGLYWSGEPGDSRDFQRSRNESRRMRQTTLGEILDKLQKRAWLNKSKTEGKKIDELIKAIMPLMQDTQLMDIGEFGRTVHAEMAALLDAARRGVPVRGCTLFTTTFPCHNCTRHIVASGIRRVVYIEPFPKSHAEKLHGDSITVDSPTWAENRVNFQPFVGIAPARYIEFFTAVPRRGAEANPIKFEKQNAKPRFCENWPLPFYSYIEQIELVTLKKKIKTAGLSLEK